MTTNEIKELIANNKTGKAIKILLDITKSIDNDLYNNMIMLSNQYNQFKNGDILNIPIDKRDLNKIIFGLLQIIQELENQPNVKNGKKISNNSELRIEHLNVKIKELYDLLNSWEQEHILADNPTKRKRCEVEIEKFRIEIEKTENELQQYENKDVNTAFESETTQEIAQILISAFIENLLQTTKRNSELKELKLQSFVKELCKFSETKYFKVYLSDGKGIIILHLNGNLAAKAFYVRKGIGYYYRKNFDLINENLGLPISNEHSCGPSAKNAKTDFENGFIEWIADENTLYIYVKKAGAVNLLDKHEFSK